MSDISIFFLVLVTASLSLKLWLNYRQTLSVQQHQTQVPAAFQQTIALEAHQKAAAYTLAKTRLANSALLVDSLWLLWLTLGGGIDLIYEFITSLTGEPASLFTGLCFLLALGVASSAIDLPLSIYRQFVLEARFGFNRMTAWLDTLLFGIYPYICLSVFFIGSWVRFDRDQYTWKSDSSQLLRTGSLRWGSNLFHIGVLFLFFGHTVGMLTPHFMYEAFISAGNKQVMAMVSGGIAGLLGFVGVSVLLHRRLSDPRIRATSKTSDIVLLLLLWLQLALGLATIPLSAQHLDGSMMMNLAEWAQRIVTFRTGGVELLADAGWIFKAHMALGMSIFLIFPFTRLVHVWSGFGTLAYVLRPYQLVRARRMNLPQGHMQPNDQRRA